MFGEFPELSCRLDSFESHANAFLNREFAERLYQGAMRRGRSILKIGAAHQTEITDWRPEPSIIIFLCP